MTQILPTALVVLFLAFTALTILPILPATACTAFIAGRNATKLGFTVNTHTNDCFDCDFRIATVPRRENILSTSSDREIPPQRFAYPRFVGSHRGSTFYDEFVDKTIHNWTNTSPVGTIPQVNTTFTYVDGSYAISNEYGVSIGESTAGGRWVSAPIFAGGKALFEIGELGRIALERARTAREAISIIGELSVKYGFYTAEWGPADNQEGGEIYTLTDPFEAWIFHISPTPDGASAIWAAQRVPDNHIAVCTNTFIIREIPFPHEVSIDQFMISPNIYDVAIQEGLFSWESGNRLDFKKTYGWAMPIYREPYVSRRQWRVQSLVAPSLRLQPTLTSFELPFSVKPDALLSLQDIISIHRDHFEGTPYDLTTGIAAGPYGNPNRWDQYEGQSNGGDISAILHTFYPESFSYDNGSHFTDENDNNTQSFDLAQSSMSDILYNQSPSLSQSSNIPPNIYRKLTHDDLVFKRFKFAQSMGFNKFNYSNTVKNDVANFIQNIKETNLPKSNNLNGEGDILTIDRSGGEPLPDEILNKGFFERSLSLFRTSYSHITTAVPSFSSTYYPNSEYLVYDPIYVPRFPSTTNATNSAHKMGKHTITPVHTILPSLPVLLYNKTYTPRHLAFASYISLHQPAQSAYTPLFSALPTQLNKQFTVGSLYQYQRDSAWWKFAVVSNYAGLYYKYIIRDIQYAQQQVEVSMHDAVSGLHGEITKCINAAVSEQNQQGDEKMDNYNEKKSQHEDIIHILREIEDDLIAQLSVHYNQDTRGTTEYSPFSFKPENDKKSSKIYSSLTQCLQISISSTHSQSHALSTKLLSTWDDLFMHIVTRYHDGYRLDDPHSQEYSATPMFYPTSWLKAVRFWKLSQGDPAVGRGDEYKLGRSTGLFALDNTTPRFSRFYEIDHWFSPGLQCLSPRLYNGTGQAEVIANSYHTAALVNGPDMMTDFDHDDLAIYPPSATNPNFGSSEQNPDDTPQLSNILPPVVAPVSSNDSNTRVYPVGTSSSSQFSTITEVVTLYFIFTIVAVGLVVLGYSLGRNSMQLQLKAAEDHAAAMRSLLQQNPLILSPQSLIYGNNNTGNSSTLYPNPNNHSYQHHSHGDFSSAQPSLSINNITSPSRHSHHPDRNGLPNNHHHPSSQPHRSRTHSSDLIPGLHETGLTTPKQEEEPLLLDSNNGLSPAQHRYNSYQQGDDL